MLRIHKNAVSKKLKINSLKKSYLTASGLLRTYRIHGRIRISASKVAKAIKE